MKTRKDFNMFNLYLRYLLSDISPKLNIKVLFYYYFHRRLNLKNPKTLDEKIQWLKLYYYKNNELVKQCADKYRAREYVNDCGLGGILNELLGVYRAPSEIVWENLPEQFVLKWNFGNGGNVICEDKNTLDVQKAIRDLSFFQKLQFHKICVEPQYEVEKLLICEKYIKASNGKLPIDYKVYCFNGDAKYVLCCFERGVQDKPAFYFFDRNWTLKRFNRQGKEAPEGFTIPKPEGIDDIFRYAEILSKPFPFVRVDFYLEHGKIFFGEMTFTPSGGFDKGRLPESDQYFGQLVTLPKIIK